MSRLPAKWLRRIVSFTLRPTLNYDVADLVTRSQLWPGETRMIESPAPLLDDRTTCSAVVDTYASPLATGVSAVCTTGHLTKWRGVSQARAWALEDME